MEANRKPRQWLPWSWTTHVISSNCVHPLKVEEGQGQICVRSSCWPVYKTTDTVCTVLPVLCPTVKLRKGTARNSRVLWTDYPSGSVTTPAGGAAPYQLLTARQWLWCTCHCLWMHLLSITVWYLQLFSGDRCIVDDIYLEYNYWFRWFQKGYTVIWH